LGDVLLFNAEDGLSDTVRPRLEAAGGEMSRVAAITAVREDRLGERGFSLTYDRDLLARHLDARPATRLVVIDPIAAYLSGGSGINNSEVRAVLTPLAQLAQERRVAVVAVTHLTKKGGSRAMYRAMGSLAFVAAARAAWGVVRDPADAERRLFLPVKNNLARGTKGLAYRLVPHAESGTARVEWSPEVIEMGIDEILRSDGSGAALEDRQDATTVQMWLAEILSNGSQEARDLQFMAKNEGITRKQLRHAAAKLHVRRKKSGFLDGWVWELPKM
jgi:putative DNA primase/helicase